MGRSDIHTRRSIIHRIITDPALIGQPELSASGLASHGALLGAAGAGAADGAAAISTSISTTSSTAITASGIVIRLIPTIAEIADRATVAIAAKAIGVRAAEIR